MPAAALVLLPACNGILGGIYDEPDGTTRATSAGELYIDASDWREWHYIDLQDLAEKTAADPGWNTSEAWMTFPVPTEEIDAEKEWRDGIYTYWYDVYGEGIGRYEFWSFQPAAAQEEPDDWSFAVHRNNVRTNGGAVAATGLGSLEELPSDPAYYDSLEFVPDEWNETDVWVIQEKMLSGFIGNQGIEINPILSSWLRVDIPPMPPAFALDSRVFVLRLRDGSLAGLQLADYQSREGVKCCLTIKYRYPLL